MDSSSAAANQNSNSPSNLVTFQPGDFVLREKTTTEAIFIIKEGQLEVFKTGNQGEKIPLGLIGSGQYVGETSLFLGTPNMSNVVALSPVTAVRLSKSSIDQQLKSVPSWLLTLIRGLIERLHNANELIRRNGWVDTALQDRVKAVEQKFAVKK